jgi:drug/metabolite transporter (DMT)-like permease
MHIAGEAVCLMTALLWAVAIAMFRRPVLEHGARTTNLAKCLLGALLQGLTLLALGQAAVLWTSPAHALLLLAASGLVGLSLGDTALFVAVARIGIHRTLLLQTLSPVFAALVALVWQDELPTGTAMFGAAVTLAGVMLVVGPRRGERAVQAPTRLVSGVLLGALAALGQGGGVVLAKAGMAEVPVMPASFVRLVAGAAGLVLLAVTSGRLHRLGRLVVSPVMRSRVVPATLLGTYLALFLMMAGIALAPAAIAATLLSVSPVFGLFIDTLVHGEPLTPRALIGTLIAVAGVAVLTRG